MYQLIPRHHVMTDFEPLYALLESNQAQFVCGPFSRRKSWYWIDPEMVRGSLKGMGSGGLEQCDTGEFLRQIGVNKPHHFPKLELCWIFLERAKGKGYARQSATAILDWVRRSLQPKTLVGYIDPQNLRSITVAERLGALPDPEAARPDGEAKRDTTVYRHVIGLVR